MVTMTPSKSDNAIYRDNKLMIMEDVTHKADANVRYSINDKDRDILNAPDTLRRTPPPDNTTISDLSYVSAADSLETIIYSIYPPTPAHDQ
ncbi:unnamed protein product [Rhizophagus irregularis]|nr:unnamed protein product [Rhizophagus irregularis]